MSTQTHRYGYGIQIDYFYNLSEKDEKGNRRYDSFYVAKYTYDRDLVLADTEQNAVKNLNIAWWNREARQVLDQNAKTSMPTVKHK